MNIFQLSCFLSVAEYLNFAKAAEHLHVTHPAVSQQIRSLEKELNVTLFRRTTRSVKLTEEGKAFLNDARQIVAVSERAKRRFNSSTYRDIEMLTIGCTNFPCMFLLADTLKKLRTERPQLHPKLQVIPFQHIYRMLEEGDLDAIVGFKESSSAKIPAVYKEIVKVPLVCVCTAQHRLSGHSQVEMDDLKGEKLVLFAPPKFSLPIAQLHGQLMEERPPSEFYFCESVEAITVLITAGYGISVLPDFVVPETSLLSKIPLKNMEPVSFGIYYKSIQGNPSMKAFIQCAKEVFSI